MCGVVGDWNPGDLAGLAATILPAESRAAGLLWQNTAKTVPATADGDPVRVAVCPYTAVEFTAPSDAARPLLWDEGGGKWSLSFDGVDDNLTYTGSAGNPSASGLSVLWWGQSAINTVLPFSRFGGAAPQWYLRRQATYFFTAVTATGNYISSPGVSQALNSDACFIGQYDRSVVSLQKDRGTPVETAETRDWWFNPSSEPVAFASTSSGFSRFSGRTRAAVLVSATIPLADRTLLLDYLGVP